MIRVNMKANHCCDVVGQEENAAVECGQHKMCKIPNEVLLQARIQDGTGREGLNDALLPIKG